MREYLFKGKQIDSEKWVEGLLCYNIYHQLCIQPIGEIPCIVVEPDSIGQYTERREFVLRDKTYNAKIFENDIVEVIGYRTVCGRNQSQYDNRIKVRGVVKFCDDGWYIDYDNNYNKSLAVPKGKELYDRSVKGSYHLRSYGCPYYKDEEDYRKKELKWLEYAAERGHLPPDELLYYDDIRVVGNIFDNADLLEG